MKVSAILLRYCVGFDISKDSVQVCLSVIDTAGKVTIKGTTRVSNKASSFGSLQNWISKHIKQTTLPIRYVMESTGVYHEALAWYLFSADGAVSIILPNKAKHYGSGRPSEKPGPQVQE